MPSQTPQTPPDTSTPTAPLSVRDKIAGFQRPLRAAELAEILGVTVLTIYKHARVGTIPHFKVGTSVRFCPTATAAWVSKQ